MKSIKWRVIVILALVAASVLALVPRSIKQRLYNAQTGQMRDSTVRRVPIKLGLDLRGGVHLALEVDESRGMVSDCSDAIRRAERVVRTRIDEFGTTEPVVQVAGNCRLIVELAGETDPARARSIVERTAFLEFRLTDTRDQFRLALPAIDAALQRAGLNSSSAGRAATRAGAGESPSDKAITDLLTTRPDSTDSATAMAEPAAATGGTFSRLLSQGRVPGEFLVTEERVPDVDRLLARPELQQLVPRGLELRWGTAITQGGLTVRPLYAVQSRAIITGEELQKAVAGRDPMTNAAEVQFELTRGGGRKFGEATGRNIGNYLAILLDGRVQGEPAVIRDRIGANGRIELGGGKTLEEANDLALVLRAGALPVPLHVVDQRTIGASLGSDSIAEGVRASVLAVGFVLLVMGVYYGLSGLLAVGALGLYVLYCLGGLAAFGFTLTLPGLAGFALSIGMAVDANVLIFERMREELDAGRSVRRAIDEGFRHAMSAIIDSNVTTALTAMILYVVGTESVQGFALTLLIGLVASMVTAVFVTRTFFLIWVKRRPTMTRLKHFTIRLFANARYDFIKVRRWAYGITAAIILPGMIMLAAKGITYSIEFTGGTMMQVRTTEVVEMNRLRTALEHGGVTKAEIQSFGSPRDFVIRARLDASGTSQQKTEAVAAAASKALDSELGAGAYKMIRYEGVSPKVGGELQQKAFIAILFSFITTLIYLAFRFEWRFGLAAVIATAHDVIATIAFIRYLDLEVSLVVVAAVLTVLGYSLNDTIVIFDRVRENLRLRGNRSLSTILNLSINETLPRTILTGGTTLATALFLSFFAGEVIKPFALVMTFGIIVGTFSSIFVASPVLLWISQRWSTPAPARSQSPPATPRIGDQGSAVPTT